MRARAPFVVSWLALSAVAVLRAQVANPIPAPVEKRGLQVEIRDVVRLPDTRRVRPADQAAYPSHKAARIESAQPSTSRPPVRASSDWLTVH